MRFKVSMKDPDTLHDAIMEAVEESMDGDLPEDEAEAVAELRQKKVTEICSKWFAYGEYLVVEIDTDEMSCVVVEN